jgi:hypothetical protein
VEIEFKFPLQEYIIQVMGILGTLETTKNGSKMRFYVIPAV